MSWISDLNELEAIYGNPGKAATVKVAASITETYGKLIAASPFLILATAGTDALDCSPRGEQGPVVRVQDPTTLLLPDRRGNNRIDSLRNIVRDPRIGLLFLIPGSGTTLRVNGTARISRDETLLQSFAVDGHEPRTVIVVTVGSVFFQCARAIVRSRIWDPESHVPEDAIPTPGHILEAQSQAIIDAAAYDAEWPERARRTLW
ncbi:MAG: pyridoxamine 5'-phosphate oxidase family protein [Pseudomonadota bacterium]